MDKDKLVEWIRYLYSIDRIDKFYHSKYFKHIKNEVLSDQHYECQRCKEKGKLSIVKPTIKRSGVVHHVKEVRDYPELALSKYYTDRFGMKHKQLIVLCNKCHEEVHERYTKNTKENLVNVERW